MDAPIIPQPPKPKLPRYLQIFILIAKLIGYFLVSGILCGLLGYGMSLLTPDLNPEDLQLGSLNDWRSMIPLYLGMSIGAIIATWFFRTAVDRQPFQTVGFVSRNIPYQLLKGGAWAIGIQTVAFLILYITGAISAETGGIEWGNLIGFLGCLLYTSDAADE